MILNGQEKQVIQKYYAETIKSRVNNLNNIIQENKAEALASHLADIKSACDRISVLETEYHTDRQHEIANIERAVENAYKDLDDQQEGHKHGNK